MKLSAVYKSSKKADTFLYIAKKDDFSGVPKALMQTFGRPEFVMLIPLYTRKIIAGIDRQKLILKIESQGFYLQLPPKIANLLEEHVKSRQGDNTHKQ